MGGRDRPEPAEILTRPEVPWIVVIYRRMVRLILLDATGRSTNLSRN